MGKCDDNLISAYPTPRVVKTRQNFERPALSDVWCRRHTRTRAWRSSQSPTSSPSTNWETFS